GAFSVVLVGLVSALVFRNLSVLFFIQTPFKIKFKKLVFKNKAIMLLLVFRKRKALVFLITLQNSRL
ncbi:hypothetical protein EGX21_03995, partial [Campylobacter jejuni]|nr:hypothetical protein [Campylobacter jejuni]